jgi:hypothetical protein
MDLSSFWIDMGLQQCFSLLNIFFVNFNLVYMIYTVNVNYEQVNLFSFQLYSNKDLSFKVFAMKIIDIVYSRY